MLHTRKIVGERIAPQRPDIAASRQPLASLTSTFGVFAAASNLIGSRTDHRPRIGARMSQLDYIELA